MLELLRRYWLGVTLIAAALLLAGALYLVALSWRPATGDYPMQGVDVAAATGAVDWPAVKAAGADFGYIVATQGDSARDARFEENWHGADAAGMHRGAIHVWSLCSAGIAQANNFNTTAPEAGDALPPALAIDFAADCPARPPHDAVIAELNNFIAAVEAHTRRPIVLLVSRAAESAYRITAAIDRPVWSARDFLAPAYAARPWRIWRASDMRRIDGVDGPINWDVMAK